MEKASGWRVDSVKTVIVRNSRKEPPALDEDVKGKESKIEQVVSCLLTKSYTRKDAKVFSLMYVRRIESNRF